MTLHTNTGSGGLKATGGIYLGKVGSSQVAIHPVELSGATPVVSQPGTGACALSCNYPCGACDVARFAVDAYRVGVPGTSALAIHVIDGLGASEPPATVDSIKGPTVDPSAQNTGVLGASVYRASKQSYVIASSAQDGVSPTTMTYVVPGTSAARHIVYDAPEASDGTSVVAASVKSGSCAVSITAGSGGGFTGHPLMFQVSAASGGCTVAESTTVAPSSPPPGGGITGVPGNPQSQSASSSHKGCGCAVVGGDRSNALSLLALALGGAVPIVRRARRRR